MHETDIQKIDLNLLVVLKVLLEEMSVTKAGERLYLSQSATSHALGRLRKMFNDPLLLRSSSGLIRTTKAEALQKSLNNILIDIEELVKPQIFFPELAQITIKIAGSDYATTVMFPQILKELTRQAPGLDVECSEWRTESFEKLKNGEIDLGLGVFDLEENSEFRTQKLFNERFVSIVRVNHPILEKDIDIESYVAWPHALISVTGLPVHSIKKAPKGHVDLVLDKLGIKRRVSLKLPHFLSAPLIVGQTDMILTLPRRIAQIFKEIANITMFDPPIDLGEYSYMQIWHRRCDNDPLNCWLRNLISAQTQDI